MHEKRDGRPHPQDEWESDLEAFAELVRVALTLLRPSPDFQEGLRERLDEAARELSTRSRASHKSPIPRLVLVGAAAGLSLVGAGAGVAWWLWKTRPRSAALGAFLPARGS